MTEQPTETIDADDVTTSENSEVETEAPKGNKEARYRVERNEAREQVSTLTARIERLNRLDIERLASETLSAPVDFWLSGNDVSSYLDDSGNVDIHRVREDAKLLVSERPGLSKYPRAVDHSQGLGGTPPAKPAAPTFSDLLKD